MKILIPVDGSRHSTSAVAFVAARAATIAPAAEIELLNVQTPLPPYAARYAGRAIVQPYYEAEAERALRPARSRLKKAGLTVRARYIVGHAGSLIARVAENEAADLIAMGSHGRTALTGLLFGSVTQTVLASCRTPVLVTRGGQPPRAASLKVGIAVDGSAYGAAAVRYVLQQRALWGEAPEFLLIHVLPDLRAALAPVPGAVTAPLYSPQEAQRLQDGSFDKVMAPLRKLFEKAGLQATEVRLTDSNAGDAIAREAAKRRLDLLATGSHGYGAVKAVVLGSVATRVAAKCRTPLLLIRR